MECKRIKTNKDLRSYDLQIIFLHLDYKQHEPEQKNWINGNVSKLLIDNTVSKGWLRNNHILDRAKKELKSNLTKNSLPKHQLSLQAYNILERSELRYKPKRRRKEIRAFHVWRLRPQSFGKIFSIFYERGQHTLFLSSHYTEDNIEDSKDVQDFLNALICTEQSRDKIEKRRLDKILAQSDKMLILNLYPRLFYEFCQHKTAFKRALKQVNKDLRECLPLKDFDGHAELLFSGLLTSSLTLARAQNDQHSAELIKRELKHNLTNLNIHFQKPVRKIIMEVKPVKRSK